MSEPLITRTVTLTSDSLVATVALQGAELVSLQKRGDLTEYIWTGEPKVWARHAPVLFPVIGKFRDESYTFDGKHYTIPQHGFARDSLFEIYDVNDSSVTLVLKSDERTLRLYPLEFELRVRYVLDGDTLHATYIAINTNETVLPCALGAHPGFLLGNDELEATTLHFSKPENSVCKKIKNGLTTDMHFTSPVVQQYVELTADMFLDDAFLLYKPASNEIRLESPSRTFTFSWGDTTTHLALWSKPGAPFICIEPWIGSPDSTGSPDEIFEKESLHHVEESISLEWMLTIES